MTILLEGEQKAHWKSFFISLGGPKAHDSSVEKHFRTSHVEQQTLDCSPPDFLLRVVALMKFVRLSRKKQKPQGLKPNVSQFFTARLKSCPDTKPKDGFIPRRSASPVEN
jgi:hypothetical protein